MLGSLQDAEDAVQETLVSAWRGLDSFAGRSSVRAWLYGIATHRCLNELRAGSRRPQRAGAAGASLPFVAPAPTRMGETPWLEPYPDALLDELPDAAPGPEARYEQREAIGLAFITALQRLPERQRAVLVLRDVLGYRAAEVAQLLDTSEATVTSALQRARDALRVRGAIPRERAPAPDSPAERALVADFADAFEGGDIERVVAMLTEDAWVTMPPEPFEYQGRAAIAEFLRHARLVGREGREARFVPIRANGQPAFAHYVRERGEAAGRLSGILVLTLAGTQIAALTRFAASNVPPQFALPADLDWQG
jgi:RNA polymerase sigma-70 factor (ECF subfamily)